MDIKYERRKKEDKPVLAICYDFDKTLSPDDMQAQGYIQSVGFDIASFWKESNTLAEQNEMDQNLAYMFMMKREAEGNLVLNKKALMEYGAKVQLFPGVEDWFKRIKQYGSDNGVIVEHYIISSGLKEMIEGTSVAKEGAFEKIYASSFYYNERGVAVWPSQVVNYTNKTQFLFRIEKGILDVNDSGVNDYFAPEDVRVPFRNIIYIGDSDTDIPCMKLVNIYGGHSIGVYNAETKDKTKVYKMMQDKRIRFFAPADYTDGSELDKLVKAIIDRTASNEVLENIHFSCKKDKDKNDITKNNDKKKRKKLGTILSLDGSGSFATTHEVIKNLRKWDDWEDDEIDMLLDIALNNNQVRYILSDSDVKIFYQSIIRQMASVNEKAQQILAEIKSNEE